MSFVRGDCKVMQISSLNTVEFGEMSVLSTFRNF